jgi:glycosyltransferase involved in cell wall biosynthesis
MRILFLSQFYRDENQPTSGRYHHHVKALADAGHRVTVVSTFVAHNIREVPEEYRGVVMRREERPTGPVWLVWAKPHYTERVWSRMANYWSFCGLALLAGLRAKRDFGGFDLVMTHSTPLFTGPVGWLLAKRYRAAMLFEAADLWPDAVVALGVMNPASPFIRAAYALERWVYRRADKLVTVSEAMSAAMAEKAPPGTRVETVTNGFDAHVFADPQPDRLPDLAPPPGVFQVMYIGTHGHNNALEHVVEAARILRDVHLRDDIRIVLVGAGEQRDALMAQAAGHGLDRDRIWFYGPVPRNRVADALANCHAMVRSSRSHPYHRVELQNTLFDNLAAGVPVVTPDNQENARVAEAAGAGILYRSEDPADLARALMEVADLPEETRAEMGRRGAAYVREHFDRRVITEKLERICVETVAAKVRAAA